MYESIAKEDIRCGLLADEDSRETLKEVEQLGSVLSDDVVSPFIRPCKVTRLRVYAAGLYARVAQPLSALHQNDSLQTATALSLQ